MSAFVWRRSALALSVLAALLAAGGGALVWWGAPLWVPLTLSVAIVGLQYAFGPALIRWLVPAQELTREGAGYAAPRGYVAHPYVGELVARRCRDAGVPLVRLGLVDDGTPNAFTFGHHRGDATVYLTRGLLERLDEDELDAVVAHELGHVRQNDFIVMTIAAIVPLVLYYAFLALRGSRDQRALPVAVGAYVGYLVAELAVLALSRARELSADHYSCATTGNGDALSSALVKIGYGIGQIREEREAEVRDATRSKDKKRSKELRKEDARQRRVQAASVFGIADARGGAALAAAADQGMNPREVVGALRWEACNPWAKVQQLLSTHPLVLRRIQALERSGLPGAPQGWATDAVLDACDGPELRRARRRFPAELVVRVAPVAAAVVALIAWREHDLVLLGEALLALGAAFGVRALLLARPGSAEPVDRIASLLERPDPSPVTGLAVNVRGRVIGRGTPGYRLSPDLVVQDDSGFAPVVYRQPWPFARSLFGLLRVADLVDQEVEVTGWYRRTPSPALELKRLVPAQGRVVRSWLWLARYAFALTFAAAGVVLWWAQSL
jgi:Zn-dependent protease with chaperone function